MEKGRIKLVFLLPSLRARVSHGSLDPSRALQNLGEERDCSWSTAEQMATITLMHPWSTLTEGGLKFFLLGRSRNEIEPDRRL